MAVSLCVLTVLAYTSAQMGLNEEMVAPMYLYPYRQLRLEPSTPRWSDCSGRFFAQNVRPIFGVCVGQRPLPLLLRQYIAAWSYWPLRWIGMHVAHHVPVLVNAIPALIAGTMLLLIGIQVGRNDTLQLACMSVAAILWFPFATLYATLYLFESLPVAALFCVWWLLDAHNRTGRTAMFVLAALVAGLACHQKLTSVLFHVPFIASHMAVFGCRDLTLRKAAIAAAAGITFPVLGLGLNLLYASTTGSPGEVLALRAQASWLQMLLASSYWVFGALPSDHFSVSDVLRTLAFVILMVRCGQLVLRRFQGRSESKVETVAALALVGTLAGVIFAYRFNPTSVPSFSLLPLVAIVSAGLWRAGGRWLAPRLGEVTARRAINIAFVAATIVISLIRWPDAYAFATQRMAIPIFSDQEYATRWLLERNVTEPLLLTSDENGVLEFLSQGQIRPFYFNEHQCQALENGAWLQILTATQDRKVDILVPSPYYAAQQLGRHCSKGAAEDLSAVLQGSNRRATQTRLSTPDHTWDFVIFSVDPAGGTSPS